MSFLQRAIFLATFTIFSFDLLVSASVTTIHHGDEYALKKGIRCHDVDEVHE